MTAPTDPPPGLIAVPVPKALRLLIEVDYSRDIRRGTWWRRRQADPRRSLEVSSTPTPVVVEAGC